MEETFRTCRRCKVCGTGVQGNTKMSRKDVKGVQGHLHTPGGAELHGAGRRGRERVPLWASVSPGDPRGARPGGDVAKHANGCFPSLCRCPEPHLFTHDDTSAVLSQSLPCSGTTDGLGRDRLSITEEVADCGGGSLGLWSSPRGGSLVGESVLS